MLTTNPCHPLFVCITLGRHRTASTTQKPPIKASVKPCKDDSMCKKAFTLQGVSLLKGTSCDGWVEYQKMCPLSCNQCEGKICIS